MDSNIAEPLFEIEKRNPHLHQLKYNGLDVWTILRYLLRIHIANNKQGSAPSFSERISRLKLTLKIIVKAALFPFSNIHIFKTYDVVFFSNQFEKRSLNGTVIDKLSSGLINAYEARGYRVFVINYGDAHHGKFNTKNILNGRILIEIAWNLYPGFFLKRQAGKIGNALKQLNGVCNVKMVIKELNFYLGLIWLYKILFRIWKPKLVFMPDYSSFSEIYAANLNGIHTIELQHGNINEFHPGYVAYSPVKREFYSKRMILFGENSVLNSPASIYKEDEMMVVGNYYLSKLLSEKKPEKILAITSNYEKSVCIPYDITDEVYIFDLLSEAARKFQNVAFVFSIRYAASEKLTMLAEECKNVFVEKDIPFQQLVLCCDFNMCSFSTCAIEALALGKPNILITRDPRTRLYYENKLDPNFSFFIDSVQDMETLFDSSLQFDAGQVRSSNEKNIAGDYDTKLQEVISRLNKESGLRLTEHSN